MKEVDHNENLRNIRSSPYLRHFKQETLIGRFNVRDAEEELPELGVDGVCNGLCIDYARHVINHNRVHGDADYITKLERKLSSSGKSPRNFIQRIHDYQYYLNNVVKSTALDQDDLQHNLRIRSILEKNNQSSVIGCTFSGSDDGHIIAIEVIRKEGVDVGYKIFDPNFGEFDLSGCNPNEDMQHCNEVLNMLHQHYKYFKLNYIFIQDLEELTKIYHLTKPKDASSYRKDYKYLVGNPIREVLIYDIFTRAMHHGDTKKIKLLLDLGVNLDELNLRFLPNNPLIYQAAENGYVGIVELLIADGADINARNENGFTSLHIAAKNSHGAIVQTLLKNGADVNAEDANGMMPLHLVALRREGSAEAAQFLIANGAQVNRKSCGDKTPLHLAVLSGNEELVKILISHGADMYMKGRDNLDAFDYASQKVDRPEFSGYNILAILKAAELKQKINHIFHVVHEISPTAEEQCASSEVTQAKKGWCAMEDERGSHQNKDKHLN